MQAYTDSILNLQVKALGALYGLQPRNCGRKGITLFKTEHAGFPDQNGSQKVRLAIYVCLLPQETGCMDQCNTSSELYKSGQIACASVAVLHITANGSLHIQAHCVLQVAALLANSKATQRHSHASNSSEPKGRRALASEKRKKAKKAIRQGRRGPGNAQDIGAAHLGPVEAAPLDSSNIGSRMLVSMGWEAGTGLGSSLQGQIEPVPVIKRRRHLGLGA